VIKLDISIPDPFLVERYLEEIARAYKIPWTSDILKQDEEEEEDEDEDDFGGGDKEEDIEAVSALKDDATHVLFMLALLS
jgi:hypothetical protein